MYVTHRFEIKQNKLAASPQFVCSASQVKVSQAIILYMQRKMAKEQNMCK